MNTNTFISTLFLLCLFTQGAKTQPSEWEPVNRGLKHLLVYTIEVDPVDPLISYCGTEYGNLYKSTDGGYNWALSREGIPSGYDNELVTALFMDKQDRNTLYAGFGGRESTQNLFISTDAAVTWSIFVTPESWKDGGVGAFWKSTYKQASRLYCGLGWANGIFISDDNGASWNQTLDSYGIQVIAGHPNEPQLLFCGASLDVALLKSEDGGSSWESAVDGIQAERGTGVRAISFAPQNSQLVFIGVTGPGYGLYKSTDQGDSWTRVLEVDQISEIAIHPNNEDLIYVSTVHEGIFRTTDGGTNWDNYSLGLPDDPIMRVRIAPGHPVRVFAVTLKHGIYRLVDEELPPQ